MYDLIFTESYRKKVKRFIKKHPDLKDRYQKTLALLMDDPHHPSLRLHKLHSKLGQYYSFDLNELTHYPRPHHHR